MIRAFASALFCVLWAVPALAYDYPFKDPYVATVFGTAPGDEFPLDSLRPANLAELNPLKDFRAVRDHEILLHDRPVPDVLWYNDTLQYSVARQRGTAPLLFIIAGTGSSYNSANCQFLQQAFFRAGFHVVSLSSPTYPNFVVSASSTQVPGYVPQDVADLYQAMDVIANDIGRDRISACHLTGYSLGGTQSAFLAELDARERRLGFDKVLLLNPAVSLMTSAKILDHLLSDSVADQAEVSSVISSLIQDLSEAYRGSNEVNFGDEFFFDLQKIRPLSDKELRVLIGVSFRLSLASMVFTSDVCTGAGYIVPRGHQMEEGESLTPYLDAATGISFEDYIDEYLIPYLRFHDPSLTTDGIVAACSLEHIGDFLRRAGNVAVMTNADDPILTPDNLDFLSSTFGSRLNLYPVGGHCGNLRYRDNVAAMLDYFRK